MGVQLRVLVLDDHIEDAVREINELVGGGYDIMYERIETAKSLVDSLQHKPWDCIISDFILSQLTATEALKILKKTGFDIPFIIVSGTMGEETAVESMKAGAQDFIVKNNLQKLVPAFEQVLLEATKRGLKNQTKESIQYERMLLRTLIDNLPDTIYFKDKECRKVVANKADVEFMGFTSESEVLGKTDIEIFPGEIGQRGYQNDLEILRTGKPFINREEEFTDSKHNKHWLLTTKIPLHNEHGQISGLVGMGHNITNRKLTEFALQESEKNMKAQNLEYLALNEEYSALNNELRDSLEKIQIMNAELIHSKNKAEESDKLKSSFLANMSHEIRTPLNAIIGFSVFLKNKNLPKEKLDQYVDIIESSGQQLLTIINDILDISKIESGQIVISNEEINVSILFKELLLLYKRQAELKNLTLTVKKESHADIILKTDENKLRQILCNLLNNALKFTKKGGVEFGYFLTDMSVSFYVNDTGIGIEPEFHSIIFEPFRQVEYKLARNYGGNGLGLSISKALVEKLGGSIYLKSEFGNGSSFVFSFPICRVVNPY